jgi:integrase
MMSDLVDRHVALHRATGRQYERQEQILHSFARYADDRGEGIIRSATALAWAAEGTTSSSRFRRLESIHYFARALHAEDPRHEIPPRGVFGPRPPQREPHIYTRGEVRTLLDAAGRLGPPGSLRPRMYVMLFGLLAATGLRISEALALQLDDVTDDGLVVRRTKFRKSRLVPLHSTVVRALSEYLVLRHEHAHGNYVFPSSNRKRLSHSTVCEVFLALVRGMGIHPGPGSPGPRIHDLRHTFAVRSLEQCAGSREDVSRHMEALSTYLGHVNLQSTYWYLHATPRLLADIASRSEALIVGGAP